MCMYVGYYTCIYFLAVFTEKAYQQWHPSSNENTVCLDLDFYKQFSKRNKNTWKRMPGSRARDLLGNYEVCLEYLRVLESKEVLKQKKDRDHRSQTKKPQAAKTGII